MGISAQQLLQSDPAYLQRQLAQQEMQRLNPTGGAAGAIGALLGRGVSNLAGGRGFFDVNDAGLRRVADVQRIMSSAQFDPNNPAAYYESITKALQDAGYGDLAPMAAAEAAKFRKEAAIERRAAASDVRAEASLRLQEEAALDTRYKNNPELMIEDARKLPDDDPRKQTLINRYYEIKGDKLTAEQRAKAELARIQADTDRLRAQAAKESKLLSLTPAQKAVDSKFAVEYNSFVNAGGASTVNKILEDLDKVETELASGKNITGRLVGVADTTGTLAYVNPAAQRVKDLAGGVIQSNLRSILGGQFAQKEGAELLARAYNPAASQEDNLSRIRELKKQIKASLAAKVEASRFYEENGTLSGYKGTKFVLESPRETPKETATGGQTGEWKILP
jgi:hypothetical protein